MEMHGGMASDNGYYMGMTLSSYAKGRNKWVYGAEYLHMTVTSLRAQGNVEDSRWGTAVRCIKKFEGWHGPEHHPYVAYGHRIRKGEKDVYKRQRKGTPTR